MCKISKSVDDFCTVRRDLLKDTFFDLQNTFNWTNPGAEPSTCNEYQNLTMHIIGDINDESFLSSQNSIEFENLKKKFQNDWDFLETSFIDTKQNMEEEFKMKIREVSSKIKKTDKMIEKLINNQKMLIESHKEKIKKFDKCTQKSNFGQIGVQSGTYEPNRRPKSSTPSFVICKVSNQWLIDLKKLIDLKITSSFDLDLDSDCDNKRKWIMKINKIFTEAIKKVSQAYNIESYKIKFESLLESRREEIGDYYYQLTQEHQRRIKAEEKYLQFLNSEHQKVKNNFDNLKIHQNEDLEILGLRLINCEKFALALELVYEVESENFMKQIFTREYDNSTSEEKAEQLMILISHIKSPCGKFHAFVVLYDIIVSKSHTESPIIIEIIKQIINLKASISDCQTNYDLSKFSSQQLSNDPIVSNILKIWSDSIKVGSYTKILKFNYNYTETFEEILLALVEKSYTGSNLNYLLDFKDQLLWLSHKYMVLNKLLDMNISGNENTQRVFSKSVIKTSIEPALYGEHGHYLNQLKRKMRQIGLYI